MWENGSSVCRPPRGGRGLKLDDIQVGARYDIRRPPRGGRGLKSVLLAFAAVAITVAPLAGGVD